jgi:hypothetical protein
LVWLLIGYEDGGYTLVRNVGELLLNYTASHRILLPYTLPIRVAESQENETTNRPVNYFLVRQESNIKGTSLRLWRVNLVTRRKEIMLSSNIYPEDIVFRAEFDGLSGSIRLQYQMLPFLIQFATSQITLPSHTGTIRKLSSRVKDRVKSSGEPFLMRRHCTEDEYVSKCCVRWVRPFHGIRIASALYSCIALHRAP